MPKSLESRPRVKSYEAWSFFKWNQQNCNHTLAYTRMSLCKCGTLQVWQLFSDSLALCRGRVLTNSLLRTFIRKFLRWKHPRKMKFVPHWKMAYCCLVISSPSYYFGFHHLSVIFLSSSVAFFPLISHQLTPSFLAASQLFKRSGHRITHSKQVGFLCKNQTTGLVYWLELGIRSSVHLFQKTVKVFFFLLNVLNI